MSRTDSSRLATTGVEKDTIFSWTNDNKYKVVLVGDSGVGKTSIFWQYIEEIFPEDVSELKVTMVDFKIKNIIVDNELVKMYIWDTAGQERYRALVSNYFKGTHGVMLVFDLSSPSSFQSVKNSWITLCRDRSPDAHMILIGNKADLEDRRVSKEEIDAVTKLFGINYFEVSAFEGININEAFDKMAHEIKRKFFLKVHPPPTVNEVEHTDTNKQNGTDKMRESFKRDISALGIGSKSIRESIVLKKAIAVKPFPNKSAKDSSCSC